jgi:hypothetical protein
MTKAVGIIRSQRSSRLARSAFEATVRIFIISQSGVLEIRHTEGIVASIAVSRDRHDHAQRSDDHANRAPSIVASTTRMRE